MAMTEAEEEKLKAELAETKTQLTDLLAKSQTEKTAAAEAEAKRAKGKAGKVELDPDVVKEVADHKARIAELEKTLGKNKSGGGFLDFFSKE